MLWVVSCLLPSLRVDGAHQATALVSPHMATNKPKTPAFALIWALVRRNVQEIHPALVRQALALIRSEMRALIRPNSSRAGRLPLPEPYCLSADSISDQDSQADYPADGARRC